MMPFPIRVQLPSLRERSPDPHQIFWISGPNLPRMRSLLMRPSDSGARLSGRRVVQLVVALVALVALVGVVFVVLPRVGGGEAYANSSAKVRPAVVVFTMFAPERQPWVDNEKLTHTVKIQGMTQPLLCDSPAELCVAEIGEGKVEAATSVVSMLNNSSIDLTRTIFITAGIAGISPNTGTLGDATIADYAVDWDLCNHVSRETDPTVKFGYLKCDSYGANEFQLNPALVKEAYQLTKNVKLVDDADAQENRSHYPQQRGKTPSVHVCSTVTADNFWGGQDASQTATFIVDQWTEGKGNYCTTQQEDNAVAGALARYGLVNHYLDVRTASDFDQPFQGQSAKELFSTFPGANIAFTNAYRVASVVAHHIAKTADR